MEDFLRSIERKAYRMAMFACYNQDDALDLVQDAMCQFVARYSDKPQHERKALFYRILQNKIRDFHRRNKARSRWRVWFQDKGEEKTTDLEDFADSEAPSPENNLQQQQAFDRLEEELKRLSLKQRQVFLLRAWEGLSVKETAAAMRCSEGSVKTHYFRATELLKSRLGAYWP